MIYWTTFSWEAFATILAGVLAAIVGGFAIWGAYRVGVRQAAILYRQTSISDRALALEETKLRADLYDRRLEVYRATQAMFAYIRNHNGVPGFGHEPLSYASDGVSANDIYRRFATAISASEFLFRPAVAEGLRKIDGIAADYYFALKAMERVANDHTEESRTAREEMIQAMKDIRYAEDELFDLFAPDLRLIDPPKEKPDAAV